MRAQRLWQNRWVASITERRAGPGLGRPAYGAAARAVVLTTVPLVLAISLRQPLFAWTGIAAWIVGIADGGGAYHTRAVAMGAMTAVGAVATVIGSLAGNHVAAAVCAMLLFGFGFGMLRAFGSVGAVLSPMLVVLAAITLGAPVPTLALALERGVAVLVGGLVAMLFALSLWRVHPYKPVRLEVARCWALLAEDVAAISALAGDHAPERAWSELGRRVPRELRQAIESARATLLATRVGRPAESPTAEQLHAQVELADQVFAVIVPLVARTEVAPATPEVLAALGALQRRLEQLALGEPLHSGRSAGRAVLSGAFEPAASAEAPSQGSGEARHRTSSPGEDARSRAVQEAGGSSRESSREEVTSALPPPMGGPGRPSLSGSRDRPSTTRAFRPPRDALAEGAALLPELRALHDLTARALEALEGSYHGTTVPRPESSTPRPLLAALRDQLATFRGHLTISSATFRHALRVGISAAVAVAIASWLHVEHGAWITLTAVVILQPTVGTTRARAIQRLAGTLVGAGAASLIGALVGHSLWVIPIFAAAIFAGRALLPVNYASFAAFITPAFVLFAEFTGHGEQLSALRVFASLAGGVIAVLAISVIFPDRDRDTVRSALARALEAARGLLAAGFAPVLDGRPFSAARLQQARRDAGLANTNAEDAFQRLIDEGGASREEAEATFTLTTYVRRFAAAALLTFPSRDRLSENPRFEAFLRAVDAELARLALAVGEGPRAPAEEGLGERLAEAASLAGEPELTRVARQLIALRSALARLPEAARPLVAL